MTNTPLCDDMDLIENECDLDYVIDDSTNFKKFCGLEMDKIGRMIPEEYNNYCIWVMQNAKLIDGKYVNLEWVNRTKTRSTWSDKQPPSWRFGKYYYRIKPELGTVPLSNDIPIPKLKKYKFSKIEYAENREEAIFKFSDSVPESYYNNQSEYADTFDIEESEDVPEGVHLRYEQSFEELKETISLQRKGLLELQKEIAGKDTKLQECLNEIKFLKKELQKFKELMK